MDHPRDQAILPVAIGPNHAHEVNEDESINKVLNETVYLPDIALPCF
jgi:hypothetical protein